jgi:hypothetical protein
LIFESLVVVDGSSREQDVRRYASETEAREGHQASVLTVAASLVDLIVMDA